MGAGAQRVFVTGASGFVGGHVVRALLERGAEITVLARDPARLGPLEKHPQVRARRGSLEDTSLLAEALPDHDACVHLALIWGAEGTDLELRDTRACASLFDLAARAGVRELVYTSSTAVHRPFSARMSGSDPLAPADVYGATKAAGELFLRAACATHGARGHVVRPGPVVGAPAFPGAAWRTDRTLLGFAEAARAGAPIHVLCGDGRQLVGARALARVLATLAVGEASSAGAPLVCVSRELTTWESLARGIVARLGGRSELVVEEPRAGHVVPHFEVDALERSLGVVLDARAEIEQHLDELASRDSG